MLSLVALLPSAIVVACVLGLRWTGLAAGAAALAASAAVWLASIHAVATPQQAIAAVADASVLTLLVAAMTVPGLLFVEATRSRAAPEAIGRLIDAVGLTPAQSAILVAVGVGVTVESLTGMGVSLLVTVPLLLRLADRRTAIVLALIGMSLMPWGALAISAHVGAKLSGLPVDQLTPWISRVSGPVAFFLPGLCLLTMRSRRPADYAVAALAGSVLWASIAASAHLVGIEVAGAAGGLAVMALMAVLAERRTGLAEALSHPGLKPYGALLAAVIVQKLALGPLQHAGLSPEIATGKVSFAVLTSPGIALTVATLATAARGITPRVLTVVAQRSLRPIGSVALFMLAARLLVECGAIGALAGLIQGFGGTWAIISVTLLGGIGGFITGSGVTSNALFMGSAATVGASLGSIGLFAALQNGAGGHVAIASLPVSAILLAALTERQQGDDALVMRWAFALGAWHSLVLILAGLALL